MVYHGALRGPLCPTCSQIFLFPSKYCQGKNSWRLPTVDLEAHTNYRNRTIPSKLKKETQNDLTKQKPADATVSELDKQPA